MGTLYVVATPIGNRADISGRAISTLRQVSLIAAEDTRHTGQFLKHLGIDRPLLSYHAFNERGRRDRLLAALAEGDVALVSDAGTPGISDPGHDLVNAAHEAGFPVSPIPGPSALIAAVAASGLVPGPFFMLGFLPVRGPERTSALARAAASASPVVLFEAAPRLVRTLGDILAALGDRQVAVAREMTKLHEEIARGTVSAMRARYAGAAARGELVLVVGAPLDGGFAAGDIRATLRALLAGGHGPSQAAREAAALFDIPRGELYALARDVAAEPPAPATGHEADQGAGDGQGPDSGPTGAASTDEAIDDREGR